MVRKVVHFQCLKDENSREPEVQGIKRAGKLTELEIRVIESFKGPTDPTVLAGATHVTIGGSGWSVWDDVPFKRELRNTIRSAIYEFGIPTLGICFGAQFLASITYGGKVVRDDARAETGPTEIVRTHPMAQYDLLEGLPSKFMAESSHHDRIVRLPMNMVPLAYSQGGQVIQAFADTGEKCWGVQFHPERGTGHDAQILEKFFLL